MDDVAWDLTWEPRLPAARAVHPFLRRAKIAKTVLCLPHPDVRVSGTVSYDGRALELDGVRGGQAHLCGTKHADALGLDALQRLHGDDGAPRDDTFFEGVVGLRARASGARSGPNTPIVAPHPRRGLQLHGAAGTSRAREPRSA